MFLRLTLCSALAALTGVHNPAIAERLQANAAPSAANTLTSHTAGKQPASFSAWTDQHEPGSTVVPHYGADLDQADVILQGRALGESRRTADPAALDPSGAEPNEIVDPENPPHLAATEPGELALLGVGLMATALIALKRAARKQDLSDPFAGSA